MGSSSGQQPVTQTTSNEPWAPSQVSLINQLTYANDLYNAGTGYSPYSGATLAGGRDSAPLGDFGINNNLWGGLKLEETLANMAPYGTQGVNSARDLGHNLIQNYGLSHPQQYTAMSMDDIYNKQGNVYEEASGQQNPYLLATIAANDRRIADRTNSAVSGAGRYGSGAHTDVLARSLAEAANPILAQDYSERQRTRLAALGGQQSTKTAIGNLLQAGADTAGKWAQLMPTLDATIYGSAERLQNVGKFYQDREQQQLANDIALYNAQQAWPWEQLQRFQAAISGAGAQGGTKVTATTPYTPTTLQRVTGGALSGAGLGSIFGAPGAGIGAIGGGLLGLL